MPLAACSKGPGDWEIEYDEYDPRIHGQVIRFNEPMAYVFLTEEQINEFTPEDIGPGRWLLDLDSAEEWKHRYKYEAVSDQDFTIIKSYWIRVDLYTKAFVGDKHRIVLQDEDGIVSFITPIDLKFTNKNGLYAISEEGRGR